MKIAVIGIIVTDRTISESVNKILSAFGEYIVCRTGVPDHKNNIFVISVIVKAPLETISALSGKLGKLNSVKVKSAITDITLNEIEER